MDCRARRRLALCGVALSYVLEDKQARPEALVSLAPTIAWGVCVGLLWCASMLAWASDPFQQSKPPWEAAMPLPLLRATRDVDFLRLLKYCQAMVAQLAPKTRRAAGCPPTDAIRVVIDVLSKTMEASEAGQAAATEPSPGSATTHASPFVAASPWSMSPEAAAALRDRVRAAPEVAQGGATAIAAAVTRRGGLLPVAELCAALLA